MLTLDCIAAAYGKSEILRDISLRVAEGESVALLGRNGAGKTTTLRTIIGLLHPTNGRILFNRTAIGSWSPHRVARLGIAFVPDDRRIFQDLTVVQNIQLARRVAKRRDGQWSVRHVFELFPELAESRNQGGATLSGGQQKMLALARALVQNPQLLLLDETAEGLAPLVVERLVHVLGDIASSGVTLLVADQNLRFARAVAQRGYIIDKGRIEHEGSLEDIWADENLVRRYLSV